MKKDEFEFDDSIISAMKALADFNKKGNDKAVPVRSQPVSKSLLDLENEEKNARNASASLPGAELLMSWYAAFKPRIMQKFVWLVLLSVLCDENGRVEIDAISERLGVKREKVNGAIRDLKKAGALKILDTEYGKYRRIEARTISFSGF